MKLSRREGRGPGESPSFSPGRWGHTAQDGPGSPRVIGNPDAEPRQLWRNGLDESTSLPQKPWI